MKKNKKQNNLKVFSLCDLFTPRIRELTDPSTDNPTVCSFVVLRICLRLFQCTIKDHCQVVFLSDAKLLANIKKLKESKYSSFLSPGITCEIAKNEPPACENLEPHRA